MRQAPGGSGGDSIDLRYDGKPVEQPHDRETLEPNRFQAERLLLKRTMRRIEGSDHHTMMATELLNQRERPQPDQPVPMATYPALKQSNR